MSNSWSHRMSMLGAPTNAVVQTKGLGKTIALMLYGTATDNKLRGHVLKLAGYVAEGHLRRTLISKFGFKEKNILGDLSNASGHGLDLFVLAPPPNQLRVRRPKTNKEGYSIYGAVNDAKRNPFAHEMETIDLTKHPVTGEPLNGKQILISFENKSTLGKSTTAQSLEVLKQMARKILRKFGRW